MSRFNLNILSIITGLVLLTGCAAEEDPVRAGLPASSYTTALLVKQPGCPNLYKVSEDLYRGAQPEEVCFPYLEQIGIRTVVDLRTFHSDEKDMEGTSLDYVSIPMAPWDPKEEQVSQFLEVVSDPTQQPVFLHCKHGADRTGTLVAAYRMVVQGWTKERAIEEMTAGPFGFHEFWSGLPKFLEKLDVEALRAEFAEPQPIH